MPVQLRGRRPTRERITVARVHGQLHARTMTPPTRITSPVDASSNSKRATSTPVARARGQIVGGFGAEPCAPKLTNAVAQHFAA
jgi:hypothetical protein